MAFCGNFHYVIYGIILPIYNRIKGVYYSYWFPDSTRYIGYNPDLPDKTIHELTREVFRRVAVNGENPEDVASDIGKTRNAVYQMKDRMMTRLKGFVAALEKVEMESNVRG